MRAFHFKAEYNQLLTPEVVAYLTQIHEYKGQQNLFIEAKADALSNLLEVAKIQSTEASNRIEGIITTDDRLKKIVREKTMPQSRSEKEIAGYRDVLATIHESHDYIPPKPTVILQLHRDLYKFSGKSIGGSFKNSDNVIAEERPDGRKIVRFEPVSAWETPGAMAALCDAFQTAAQDAELDPLLLIPIFILDFLCIHPFNDGNGRMSRLLTLLMLYRNGYMVGKYISIEHLIEQSKSTYYEALDASTQGWDDNANDYAPFTNYLLGIILSACKEFDERINLTAGGRAQGAPRVATKGTRIEALLDQSLVPLSKADILARMPDTSTTTIERTLKSLLDSGTIIKIGAGRSTRYVKRR